MIQCHANKDAQQQAIVTKEEHGKLSRLDIFERLDAYVPSVSLSELRVRFGCDDEAAASVEPTSRRPTSQSRKAQFCNKYDVFMPNKSFRKSQTNVQATFKLLAHNETTCEPVEPTVADFMSNHLDDGSKNRSNYLYAFVAQGDVLYYLFDTSFVLPKVHDDDIL